MRIALDAMGSDRAPLPEVEGAVKAAASGEFEIVLVGDEARLKAALEAYPKRERIRTVHASEAISMRLPMNGSRLSNTSATKAPMSASATCCMVRRGGRGRAKTPDRSFGASIGLTRFSMKKTGATTVLGTLAALRCSSTSR